MMNTFYMSGSSFALPFFAFIHTIGAVSMVIGGLFLLSYAWKHLTQKQLKKWGFGLVIGGFLLCILTLPFFWGRTGEFKRGGQVGRGMMMQNWQDDQTGAALEEKSAAQIQEEADGKALLDVFNSKATTCADLTDENFELIGEYVMGTRLGSSHEQMNTNMKQMMGDQGESNMHILIGKQATGCK